MVTFEEIGLYVKVNLYILDEISPLSSSRCSKRLSSTFFMSSVKPFNVQLFFSSFLLLMQFNIVLSNIYQFLHFQNQNSYFLSDRLTSCCGMFKRKSSFECLPKMASSIPMNCHQRGFCLLCETPAKEPMELAVISNFHHQRPYRGSNSGPLDAMFDTLTTKPRIHNSKVIVAHSKIDSSVPFGSKSLLG